MALCRTALLRAAASGTPLVQAACGRVRTMTPNDVCALNDGTTHPVIGFGTYKVGVLPSLASGQNGVRGVTGVDIKEVVSAALASGYKMLDCAAFYENEREIGEAVAAHVAGGGERPYLCTKIWSKTVYEGEAAIVAEVERMLRDLQVAQLDLLLVHWPVPRHHILAYKTLQALQKAGKVRSIGVSNYTIEDYKALMADEGVTVKPTVNQIEANAHLYRKETIDFFQGEGVVVQAYRPLGAGKILASDVVVRIAAARGASPPQVLLAWLLRLGIVPLPKSEKPERIRSNIDVFGVKLTDEDVAQLSGLTTQAALDVSLASYRQNILRDTGLSADDPDAHRPVTAN